MNIKAGAAFKPILDTVEAGEVVGRIAGAVHRGVLESGKRIDLDGNGTVDVEVRESFRLTQPDVIRREITFYDDSGRKTDFIFNGVRRVEGETVGDQDKIEETGLVYGHRSFEYATGGRIPSREVYESDRNHDGKPDGRVTETFKAGLPLLASLKVERDKDFDGSFEYVRKRTW